MKPRKDVAVPHVIHAFKIRPVVVALIRVPPAEVTQRKFRQHRADELLADFNLDLCVLSVNYRDNVYWCFDGQHRLWALKKLGFADDQGTIDCMVYENLTDKEMANRFIKINTGLHVATFDKFHIGCTAEYERETAVRRSIESQGLHVSRAKDPGCIGAVASCMKAFDRAGGGTNGEVVLGQVVRTIRDGLGNDAAAYDGRLIEGLGLVFNRYNGRTNEKDLAHALGSIPQGVIGLLRRAEAQRERTGNSKTQCVAASIVDAYNKAAKKGRRLASWWKSSDVEA